MFCLFRNKKIINGFFANKKNTIQESILLKKENKIITKAKTKIEDKHKRKKSKNPKNSQIKKIINLIMISIYTLKKEYL